MSTATIARTTEGRRGRGISNRIGGGRRAHRRTQGDEQCREHCGARWAGDAGPARGGRDHTRRTVLPFPCSCGKPAAVIRAPSVEREPSRMPAAPFRLPPTLIQRVVACVRLLCAGFPARTGRGPPPAPRPPARGSLPDRDRRLLHLLACGTERLLGATQIGARGGGESDAGIVLRRLWCAGRRLWRCDCCCRRWTRAECDEHVQATAFGYVDRVAPHGILQTRWASPIIA